jgi:type II secretory pathway pseudopilin PulG
MAVNTTREKKLRRGNQSGYSLVQLLVTIAIAGTLSAVAIPQMVVQRRLMRSRAITREIATQMRLARQLAMSQRQAITFQYDTATATINIIDHNNDTTTNPLTGLQVLSASGYPNTTASTVIGTISLAQGGLTTAEIGWGIPAGIPGPPTTADGLSVPDLSTASNKLNITFQRDGSVIDSTGNPNSQALFIYNNKAPDATAAAISVMGLSGRVKIWRFNNVDSYVE